MAEELKEAFGADPTLIEGKGGVFEVELDGKLIFSKNEAHRFPEKGEIKRLISGR